MTECTEAYFVMLISESFVRCSVFLCIILFLSESKIETDMTQKRLWQKPKANQAHTNYHTSFSTNSLQHFLFLSHVTHVLLAFSFSLSLQVFRDWDLSLWKEQNEREWHGCTIPESASFGRHRRRICICGHHPHCPGLCELSEEVRGLPKKMLTFLIYAPGPLCLPKSFSSSYHLFYPSLLSSPPIFLLCIPCFERLMNVNVCECQIRWSDVYRAQRRQCQASETQGSLASSFFRQKLKAEAIEHSVLLKASCSEPGRSNGADFRDQSQAALGAALLCGFVAMGYTDKEKKKCQSSSCHGNILDLGI